MDLRLRGSGCGRVARGVKLGAMYESVIGLEVHLALNTASKLFCGCPADSFQAEPNANTCPVCLGLPGTLPQPNRAAVEKALMFALAVGCRVPAVTRFQRKHYFYPDAPKNYQTSQGDGPIGEHGQIELRSGRVIGITRCHLEEDAGRSVHPPYKDHSLIDLNRAGSPLIEMVTEPEIRTPDEAREFLELVRAIAQALGVSEASPEEGKMRADVNVSLRRPGEPLGTKVEVKNLNSFRSVAAALEFEIKRQTDLLQSGKQIVQQTRGWNEGGQKTYLMREKETSADYRYLVDPDLAPIHISSSWLDEIRAATPELPAAREARYLQAGVRETEAHLLAMDNSVAKFFDEALTRLSARGSQATAQQLANWLGSEVIGQLNSSGQQLHESALSPAALVELVTLVAEGSISGRTGKDLLPEVLDGADPAKLVEERGLKLISDDSALQAMVDEVVAANPELVEKVRENPNAINALLGQVMRQSKGQAKPDVVRRLLEERLLVS